MNRAAVHDEPESREAVELRLEREAVGSFESLARYGTLDDLRARAFRVRSCPEGDWFLQA